MSRAGPPHFSALPILASPGRSDGAPLVDGHGVHGYFYAVFGLYGVISLSRLRMFDRMKYEARFLEHLGRIERVAVQACSNHSIWGAEAEDFVAWIKMKLMADDYAIFRSFRGEAELSTYLTTVVVRQFHEYWRQRLGRWRPSVMAERLGSPAKDLEALVHRDGYTLQEAGEKLRTAGRTTLSDVELARLFGRLPPRTPPRPVEVAWDPKLGESPGLARVEDPVRDSEAAAHRGRVMEVLERAMGQLDPEDRMIARMHIENGYTLADVARTLRLEQKPLYRRLNRMLERLRGYLEANGVRRSDVHELLWEQEAG